MEATLDKTNAICKYGLIEGGDSKLYRVARGGMNPRGRKMEDLMKVIGKSAESEEGGDDSEIYESARKLFVTALEPFYNEERIISLLDEGCFSWVDVGLLVRTINGDNVSDVVEKKPLPESN